MGAPHPRSTSWLLLAALLALTASSVSGQPTTSSVATPKPLEADFESTALSNEGDFVGDVEATTASAMSATATTLSTTTATAPATASAANGGEDGRSAGSMLPMFFAAAVVCALVVAAVIVNRKREQLRLRTPGTPVEDDEVKKHLQFHAQGHCTPPPV